MCRRSIQRSGTKFLWKFAGRRSRAKLCQRRFTSDPKNHSPEVIDPENTGPEIIAAKILTAGQDELNGISEGLQVHPRARVDPGEGKHGHRRNYRPRAGIA